ncbi:MAG: Nif3-like dinuclear metal center hexameric protein [Ruthenibacterium sp.]
MLTNKEALEYLDALAPLSLACEWDNPGLLMDSGEAVTGILCALDITDTVVHEAQEKKCNLIVSHHPVIFHPLHALRDTDVPYRMAQLKVSAICMHTNLDAANGGVNDTLAQLLELQNVQPFGDGMGRIGVLTQPIEAAEFVRRCRALFGPCQYTAGGEAVSAVAVLGGSGGDEAQAAFDAGADAYVTGEAAHHHAIAALHQGKTLVAAGHYATEHPVVAVLTQRLAQRFPDVLVCSSENETAPFTCMEAGIF